MRIVYAGPVPPMRGGIAQHGARLVEALRSSGNTVTVVSWAAQYPRRFYPGEERDPDAPAFPGAKFFLRWWSPWSWWRAGRLARDSELLVFPWVTPFQAVAYRVMMWAATPTPSVVIVHNPLPHEQRFFDRAVTRVVVRKARGTVVHARGAADEVHRMASRVPVRVVAHPPNLTVTAAPLPAGPPWRLLFLGFVRPYKGLGVAIDAVASLRSEGVDARLTVAGAFWGPVEPWRERIRKLGLEDAIDLRPEYVPDAELGDLLASHHLVVAPYRSATQSGIVPLAYAAGRPVVATTVGGLPEVVAEGETGTLAPPADPEAFAKAVQRAIEHLGPLAEGARGAGSTWAEVADAIVSLAVPGA